MFLSLMDEYGKEGLNLPSALYSSLAVRHVGYLLGHAVFP